MKKINLSGDEFEMDFSIIVGRQAYDIGCRVVKWNEPQGFDGYKRPLRISTRKNGVDDIEQLVTHNSGQDRKDPSTMYKVLWSQRKLSVHFALDEFSNKVGNLDAGPILWQFVDCDWVTRHGSIMNKSSIGIEICHFPMFNKDKNYYNLKNCLKKNNVPHKTVCQPIGDSKKITEVYAITDECVDSLARLWAGCWVAIGHQRKGGFKGAFGEPPKLPTKGSDFAWGVIQNPKKHKGLLLHRNFSKKKGLCPAGLDLDRLESLVGYYYRDFRFGLGNQ